MVTEITVCDTYVLCVCDGSVVRVPKKHYDRALMALIPCTKEALVRDFEGVVIL